MLRAQLDVEGATLGEVAVPSVAAALRRDVGCALGLPLVDVSIVEVVGTLAGVDAASRVSADALAVLNAPLADSECPPHSVGRRVLQSEGGGGGDGSGGGAPPTVIVAMALSVRAASPAPGGSSGGSTGADAAATQTASACAALAALRSLNASADSLAGALVGTTAVLASSASPALQPVYRLTADAGPAGAVLACSPDDDPIGGVGSGAAAQAALEAAAAAKAGTAGGSVVAALFGICAALYAVRRVRRTRAAAAAASLGGTTPALQSPLHAATAVKGTLGDATAGGSGRMRTSSSSGGSVLADPRSPVHSAGAGAGTPRNPSASLTLRLFTPAGDDDSDNDDPAGHGGAYMQPRAHSEEGDPAQPAPLARPSSMTLSRRRLATAAEPEDAARTAVEPKRVVSLRKSQQLQLQLLQQQLEGPGVALPSSPALRARGGSAGGGGDDGSESDSTPGLVEQGRATPKLGAMASPAAAGVSALELLTPPAAGRASGRFASFSLSARSPPPPLTSPRGGGVDGGAGGGAGGVVTPRPDGTFEQANPMLARARSVQRALAWGDLPLDYTGEVPPPELVAAPGAAGAGAGAGHSAEGDSASLRWVPPAGAPADGPHDGVALNPLALLARGGEGGAAAAAAAAALRRASSASQAR